LEHRNWISMRPKRALARVLLACVVFLLIGFASVSSALAHVQPHVPSHAETIAPAAAPETCCHDVDGDPPAFACAASVCCPAPASVALASSPTLALKTGAVSPACDARAGSLAPPPLLHPPIFA
jgi:hypothetical protein